MRERVFGPNGGEETLRNLLEPVGEMRVTRRLDGYAAAWFSAVEALLLLWGETPGWRKIHRAALTHGEESPECEGAYALALASVGGLQFGSMLPKIEAYHRERGTLQAFLRELSKALAAAAKLASISEHPAPVPKLGGVAYRLTVGWLRGGYWLAQDEEIARDLATTWPSLKGTSGGNVFDLVTRRLKLARYPGAGRVEFPRYRSVGGRPPRETRPRFDNALCCEVRAAISVNPARWEDPAWEKFF